MLKKTISRLVCLTAALLLIITAVPFGFAAPAVGEDITDDSGTQWHAFASVNSPSGKLTATFLTDKDGEPSFTVSSGDGDVIGLSPLGIVTTDCDLSNGLAYNDDLKIETVTDQYELKAEKSSSVSDTCSEAVMSFSKGGLTLTVNFRAYDTGVAYRYNVGGKSGTASVVTEKSGYNLKNSGDLYYQTYSASYESDYETISSENLLSAEVKGILPALMSTKVNEKQYWVLLAESNVWGGDQVYCSSRMLKEKESYTFLYRFGNNQYGNVEMEYPFNTPWRLAAVSTDINDVCATTLVTTLADDSKIEDTSWITPGKSVWSWWTTGDPITVDEQYDYIDAAAELGFEYSLIDYGWYLWDNYEAVLSGLSEYAAKKGVKLLLWYGVNNTCHPTYPENSLLSEEDVKRELEWVDKLGFSGVKVDFFDSDAQKEMQIMKWVAECAAEHKLGVIYHGCISPRGEQRTYPNVLSYEAIRGMENAKWKDYLKGSTLVNQVLIRGAVGPTDFTPTAMQTDYNSDSSLVFSNGFSLATTVTFQTGVIHFARATECYEDYEGLPFMLALPDRWDESRITEAVPNICATVARRSGDTWFIGTVASAAYDAETSLSFIGDGSYYMYMWSDGEDGLTLTESTVTSADSIKVSLKALGGYAAIISKDKLDLSTPYDGYTYYEAEEYSASKYPAVQPDLYASSSKVLIISHYNADQGAQITYDAECDGKYQLILYCGGSGQIAVDVNGEPNARIDLPTYGKIMRKYTAEMELKKGENVINIYCQESSLGRNLLFDKFSVHLVAKDSFPWLIVIAIVAVIAVAAVALAVAVKRKKSIAAAQLIDAAETGDLSDAASADSADTPEADVQTAEEPLSENKPDGEKEE